MGDKKTTIIDYIGHSTLNGYDTFAEYMFVKINDKYILDFTENVENVGVLKGSFSINNKENFEFVKKIIQNDMILNRIEEHLEKQGIL